eukprot:Blabericola_migrator_1__7903@NODE_4042_length_1361_cov_4_078053_g2492_i0_p1_GENE_NODE_4042_length_1361_cov_4_078053_g2492_i0NODE_4042_length_1361_cov_4_078053_g2492_i0_p1_ORF_typecomplete_len119_score12_44_NODE_4042_length_1361_cov_4_078053_g2492_i06681024
MPTSQVSSAPSSHFSWTEEELLPPALCVQSPPENPTQIYHPCGQRGKEFQAIPLTASPRQGQSQLRPFGEFMWIAYLSRVGSRAFSLSDIHLIQVKVVAAVPKGNFVMRGRTGFPNAR